MSQCANDSMNQYLFRFSHRNDPGIIGVTADKEEHDLAGLDGVYNPVVVCGGGYGDVVDLFDQVTGLEAASVSKAAGLNAGDHHAALKVLTEAF